MVNNFIRLFLDLISIDALPGYEKPVADFIKKYCSELGLSVTEDQTHQTFGGTSGNLICKVGDGGDTVLLSHMDTARSTKNVKPVVTSDRIQSDGNSVLGVDNRAGIAIILYALSKALNGNVTKPNITIAFTICEETTMIGSRNIALDNIKMGYVLDSSLRPGHFIDRSYGARSFEANIHGRASHSGIAPEDGVNAIQIAARAINNLSVGRVDEHTTVNVANIIGGNAINVVPDFTTVIGEVRSLIPEQVSTVINFIKDAFEESALFYMGKVDFKSQWEFKPYQIEKDSRIYQRIYSAIGNSGLKPKPIISAGGSDANSLNEKGIPSINIGIGAQNPHSNNEYIHLEDLNNSVRIALELIKNN
jgi:tripeptide aminopeptidase